MTTTQAILWIGGLATLGIIAGIFGLRQLIRRRIIATLKRYPSAQWQAPGANLFGVQSRGMGGMGQIRGNGTLLIANGMLVFEMWIPEREVKIPLKRVTKVDTVNSFLGKTRGTPLLRVSFQNDDNQPDAAAWQVSHVHEAVHAVQTAIEAS